MNAIRMNALSLRKGLFLSLAILPILLLFFLIHQYSVNVPYWDQWGKLGLSLEKIHEGQFSFQFLVSQHNESRPFFPRLFFLALAFLTGWNVKYEILAIVLLACLISLNFFLLVRETVKPQQSTLLFLTLLLNLLIFSPVQWENWLWGVQLIVYVPIFCLTANILIASKKLDIRVKVISQIIICTVGTYSYANGMICWLLSPLALFLLGYWVEMRRQTWLIAFWILICIANFWLYFKDYVKPAQHPSLNEALVHPFSGIVYFLSFLGSPLSVETILPSGGNVPVAACVGAVLVLLFILQIVYLFIFFQRSLLQQLGGWILIQLYTLISALITTVGRVGFGVEQSLASRYTTFSVYLAIGLIGAIAIIIQDIRIRQPFAPSSWSNRLNDNETLKVVITSLVTGLLILHLLTFYNAVKTMQAVQRDRLYGKTCLIFIKFVSDECIKASLYPDAPALRTLAEIADQFDFFQPPLAANRRIRQSDPGQYSEPGQFGFFDTFVSNSDVYTASGWAVLPNEKRPADAILLTFQRGDRSLLFEIAPVKNARQDVAKVLQDDRYTTSGWSVTFPARSLPQRDKTLVIEAWAFNTESGEAFKISTSHSIDRPVTPVTSN